MSVEKDENVVILDNCVYDSYNGQRFNMCKIVEEIMKDVSEILGMSSDRLYNENIRYIIFCFLREFLNNGEYNGDSSLYISLSRQGSYIGDISLLELVCEGSNISFRRLNYLMVGDVNVIDLLRDPYMCRKMRACHQENPLRTVSVLLHYFKEKWDCTISDVAKFCA